jgi:hypothetical protein
MGVKECSFESLSTGTSVNYLDNGADIGEEPLPFSQVFP